GVNKTLAAAHMRARKFVEGYPIESGGTGLLLTGSIGVGKTHLAVGILQAVIAERGASGLFWDYRELLKEVQNSYNREVQATEMEILRPICEAEVLVLDELGAAKPSEWVWDTVAQVLNSRYNDRRTTIITTNYANIATLGVETGSNGQLRASMREETQLTAQWALDHQIASGELLSAGWDAAGAFLARHHVDVWFDRSLLAVVH